MERAVIGAPAILLLSSGHLLLQRWVRTRARQGGFPRPEGVLLVSALKGQGVQELLIRLHREVGPAGDVWVVRGRCHLSHHGPQHLSIASWLHAPMDMRLVTLPCPFCTLPVIEAYAAAAAGGPHPKANNRHGCPHRRAEPWHAAAGGRAERGQELAHQRHAPRGRPREAHERADHGRAAGHHARCACAAHASLSAVCIIMHTCIQDCWRPGRDSVRMTAPALWPRCARRRAEGAGPDAGALQHV